MAVGDCGGYTTRSGRYDGKNREEGESAKAERNEEEHLKICRGLSGNRDETVSAWPTGFRENVLNCVETALPGGRPGSAMKKEEVYQESIGGGSRFHRCAPVGEAIRE